MKGRWIIGCVVAIAVTVSGCRSPEDGRPRAGGHGGDGGNYVRKPIHAPSKIDGSRQWTFAKIRG